MSSGSVSPSPAVTMPSYNPAPISQSIPGAIAPVQDASAAAASSGIMNPYNQMGMMSMGSPQQQAQIMAAILGTPQGGTQQSAPQGTSGYPTIPSSSPISTQAYGAMMDV